MYLKKFGKVILVFLAIIILLIVLVVGSLMIFKPDLVRAVYDGLVLDSEQIEEKKKENDRKLASTINEFGFTLSEEDLERMNNGELSEQDIKDILLGNTASPDETVGKEENIVDIQVDLGKPDNVNKNPDKETQNSNVTDTSVSDKGTDDEISSNGELPKDDKPSESSKPSGNTNSSQDNKPTQNSNPPASQGKPVTPVVGDNVNANTVKPNPSAPTDTQPSAQTKEYEEKTAELVARMYSLKSQYLGQINGIVASMKAQYAALPKEQRTTAAKTSIANSYLGEISALEAQCDAQVNSVVTELRGVLAKSGKDSSLADSILAAYNAEKETTKAAYISQYSD